MTHELNPHTLRPWARKWERELSFMLDGKPRNSIEHGRELGTTCLHSDISGFEARGLRFDRERITVSGFGAARTAVTAYRLRPDSFALAHRLLSLPTPQNASNDAKAYLLASTGARA